MENPRIPSVRDFNEYRIVFSMLLGIGNGL
jgi:hypothetical protein